MQKVVIGNNISKFLLVLVNSLNGGGLLFTIYVIDIVSEVDVSSNINLFADDTNIFSHSITTSQNSLDKVYH